MRATRSSVLVLLLVMGGQAGFWRPPRAAAMSCRRPTLLSLRRVSTTTTPIAGDTTFITIINTGAAAQIVHSPVVGRRRPAPGLQPGSLRLRHAAVNIRDILYFGYLPATGTAGELIVSARGGGRSGRTDGRLALPQSTAALLERCDPGSPVLPRLPPNTARGARRAGDLPQASQTSGPQPRRLRWARRLPRR